MLHAVENRLLPVVHIDHQKLADGGHFTYLLWPLLATLGIM